MKTSNLVLIVAAALMLGGCMQPKGTTVAEKRAYVEGKRTGTMNELFASQPDARAIVEQAAGYGVFSNIGTQFLFAGTLQGYGVVVNNETGGHTYMRMGGLKGGIGVGIQGYRAVYVFNDKHVMHRFVTEGWDLGAAADATATTEDQGLAAGGKASIERSIRIYQFTDAGIKASVTLGGSKYWPDEELNN